MGRVSPGLFVPPAVPQRGCGVWGVGCGCGWRGVGVGDGVWVVLAHPPADWTPWEKTNDVFFSLHTTPWNKEAGVDIETLDVAGGRLVDLL